METEGRTANRRPLKSRATRWANAAARAALATGISANGMSFVGVVIAAFGAAAIVGSSRSPWLLLVGAICVQLRLLANMLDGLIAVEGGRGGPTGAMWNEVPDRIEDSLLLVAAGYAVQLGWLGWLAALLAAVCAYVRTLGGALGFEQDFTGPMAKPHRMAALTVGLVAAWATTLLQLRAEAVALVLSLALAVVVLGTAATIARRLVRIAAKLRR